jgi:hypothetical protein
MRFRLTFGAHLSLREHMEGRPGSAVAYLRKQNHVLFVDKGTIISTER